MKLFILPSSKDSTHCKHDEQAAEGLKEPELVGLLHPDNSDRAGRYEEAKPYCEPTEKSELNALSVE